MWRWYKLKGIREEARVYGSERHGRALRSPQNSAPASQSGGKMKKAERRSGRMTRCGEVPRSGGETQEWRGDTGAVG